MSSVHRCLRIPNFASRSALANDGTLEHSLCPAARRGSAHALDLQARIPRGLPAGALCCHNQRASSRSSDQNVVVTVKGSGFTPADARCKISNSRRRSCSYSCTSSGDQHAPERRETRTMPAGAKLINMHQNVVVTVKGSGFTPADARCKISNSRRRSCSSASP